MSELTKETASVAVVNRDADDPYVMIARHAPNLPAVGGAYVGITETVAAHERSFNRWYEDDHFYSGAMSGPWILAGRRWLATAALRRTWLPADSPLITPGGQGCFLKVYWFAQGHEDDAQTWMRETYKVLMTPERFPTMPMPGVTEPRVRRNSVYSSFQRHLFTCLADPGDPLREIHALDYPFGGLALDIIRSRTPVTDLATRLKSDVADTLDVDAASCKIAVAFERAHDEWLPAAGRVGDGEVAVFWFFVTPPSSAGYAPLLTSFHGRVIDADAELVLSASFIPTIPGTDAYIEEMRAF